MNKSTIQKLLPDYVQGRLSGEDKQRMEAAISADRALAQECEKWREYFASMKTLPHLTAPPGFALKVMQGISEQEKKPSLVDRIFKPFHIKLPLEAAAVLSTVLVVIILYRPFEKPGMHPESQIAMAEKSAQPEMMEDKTAPASAPQPSSPMVRSESKQKKISQRGAVSAKHAYTGIAKPAAQIALAEKAQYAEEMPALAPSEAPPASATVNHIGKKDQEMPMLARSMTPAASAAVPAEAVARLAEPLPGSHSTLPEKPVVVTMELAIAEPEEELGKAEKSRKFYKAKSTQLADIKPESNMPQDNKIERAIRAAGGSTLKIESETHDNGVIQYSFEIPDSTLSSLAAALRGRGTLTYDTTIKQSKRGLVRILLLVHEKKW